MKSSKTVFLFDIDGVLVEARGYRTAVQATVRHFTARFKTDHDHIPGEDAIALFESQGITSEWDMVPLSLAIQLDTLLSADPALQLPSDLAGLCGFEPVSFPPQIDYRAPIVKLGGQIRLGEHPAATAYRLCIDNNNGALFPFLKRQALLGELFADTRDVFKSTTTRIFQHYTLGSQNFSRTYRLPVEIETPSLLKRDDRPLLEESLRNELLSRSGKNGFHMAAYTLRPSLPPRGLTIPTTGYAPEAEIALEKVGLSPLPLIGYGRILYLAGQTGAAVEEYSKPSPVHALAAIFAALTGEENSSLILARKLYLGEAAPEISYLKNQEGIQVHVFEDSPGGIQAVRKAGEILSAYDLPVQVKAWGVATHPEKTKALERIAVPVFPTVSAAIHAAL
jgi:hypothetical protein